MRKRFLLVVSLVLILGMSTWVGAQNKVKLDFPSWWWGELGNKEYLVELKKAYERMYPNVEINGYDLAFREYQDTVLAQISAGMPPDILHLLETSIGQYIRIGALEPLDKWMDKTDIKQRFTPLQSMPPVVTDGKTYGLYQMIAVYIPFYNRRLFKEVGVEVFPTNMDDFITVAQKLTKAPAQYGYAMVSKPGEPWELALDIDKYVVGMGARYNEGGAPAVNSPEFIAAMKMYKKVFDSGITPKGMNQPQFRQMWWEGKVATIIDGSWMYGFAQAHDSKELPYLTCAMTPFPTHKSNIATQIFAIAKDSKHKEEAWKFLELFATPEWQSKQVEMTRNIAPQKGGGVTTKVLNKFPWMYYHAITADISEFPYGYEIMPYLMEFRKILTDYVERILFLDAPIEETMNSCQKELEKMLEMRRGS